ncbi:LysE family translocator (plasmid) [Escherichia coli]|uniref:LysE family translocator n=1 Tax=Escherichia coli TaxID=562 RepID=UPI0022302131|nr:LysE family translocator [Escherichia coli]MDM8883952.1 LysE family translocator [Escherichia coli]WNU69961.1 LysE family translocator [Escherichia coli]
MEYSTLFSFAIVTLSQTISIGPGVALVINNAFSQGLKSSIKTSVYIRSGEAIVMVISLLTLSSTSSIEQHFYIIKILGGSYLIYIGVMGLINKKNKKSKVQKPLLIPLLNPKAYLFFAALIPAFIDDNTNIALNFFILGVLFISFLTDIIYIAISLTIRDKLTPSFSRYISICSSIFILGTGIYFILT